ncbi:MAG: hypothetical protein SVM80_01960 [Halobacteriota archaeon]|nr:hypothetical protein [Halobacteriota archaeon]
MNKYLKIGLFGFLIWLIPFIVSVLIYPIHDTNRALFESIMPLTGTASLVLLLVLYFGKVQSDFLKEGVIVGVIWFAISLVIDLILFIPESPMHMTFGDYMMDIGITYFSIPIICVGFGYLLEKT